MKVTTIIIVIEYAINFIILSLYHMHMFQLNSYFYAKHGHWMKKNIGKIVKEFLLIEIPFFINYVATIIDNTFLNILVIIILLISIIYNMPKVKSKISLKFTARVKRMLVTEAILVLLLFLAGGTSYENVVFKISILNILSVVLELIANFINKPIEKAVRQYYINDAKKILKSMPNLIVIGVTGSYGKTSVKNFLYQTLSGKYEVLKTPKNYNTTMGVVKTIREELKPIHQIFICEMGATHVGDIKEICDIVNPTIGIITSVGPQHLESFKSIDNVLKTKFELQEAVAKNGGSVFLNYNNDYIKNKKVDSKYFSYGIDDESLDYKGFNIKSTSSGISFDVKKKDEDEVSHFETKVIGKHNVINLVGAIACAHYLGVPYKKMVPKVRELKSVAHRLELIDKGPYTIIDDSYNSNPVSSKSAIDTLNEFEGTHVIVTPGLIELGANEEKYNYELGEYMAKCDYICIVGEKNEKNLYDGSISKGFDKDKIIKCSSPTEAVSKITSLNIPGNLTILLENDLPDNYN